MKLLLLLLLIFFYSFAEPIMPLPLTVAHDAKKAKLGQELFFDPILSRNNTISCATCHDITNGGDDNLAFSFGIDGQEGDINSPTVLNALFNFRQFWNGSAENLAEQAKGPIENPIEMGHSFDKLIPILLQTPYKKKFESLYKEGITKESITDAIAEFEKTLITPNAPFDKYLRGDTNAITQKQKDGYSIFKSKGCIACHHGINVGGNLYNKFGVMEEAKSKRKGRFEVTGNEADMYYFKVPTLRNIALTAPYLHDGRFETLDDTVKFMAHYQLGCIATQEEVDKIVAFLHSLSGEIPQLEKK